MKKLFVIIIMLMFLQGVKAQRVNPSMLSEGKIEVIAYSSAQLLPSDVYVSFVLKDYFENGLFVKTDQSLSELKKIITQLGCNNEDLSTGNIYGYLMNMDDGSTMFMHKTQYVLRMNTIECAQHLLESMNKKSIESFKIDELDAKQTESIINKLQEEAFKSAAEKADVFLGLFKEERGRLLGIQEVDGTFLQPESHTNGTIVKSIKRSGDIHYYETKYNNSKIVKLEYEAKVIFEIK